ncbi:uncharacterized protein LOC116420176 [Sarcophilus harrisii]|uniref:uncharacterized protein LOC116420176 n=1 Tax=Sarcophilus harrisii TaxID=9305 RepID=UPI000273C9E5|nr:uncharacterized protein LOC116420176 [Sarcophilus harrisii]
MRRTTTRVPGEIPLLRVHSPRGDGAGGDPEPHADLEEAGGQKRWRCQGTLGPGERPELKAPASMWPLRERADRGWQWTERAAAPGPGERPELKAPTSMWPLRERVDRSWQWTERAAAPGAGERPGLKGTASMWSLERSGQRQSRMLNQEQSSQMPQGEGKVMQQGMAQLSGNEASGNTGEPYVPTLPFMGHGATVAPGDEGEQSSP